MGVIMDRIKEEFNYDEFERVDWEKVRSFFVSGYEKVKSFFGSDYEKVKSFFGTEYEKMKYTPLMDYGKAFIGYCILAFVLYILYLVVSI